MRYFVKYLNSSLVIMLALLVFFSDISTTNAISYGGFGGRPAYPRVENSRTDDIFVHSLAPGSVQNEGLLVINNTEEIKTLMVYSADSTPSTEGGFACKQLAEPQSKVGTWIEFSKPQPTVSRQLDAAAGEVDTDHDGLTDEEEAQYATDASNPDTDNDGYLDGTEVFFGYNPNGNGLISDSSFPPEIIVSEESEEVGEVVAETETDTTDLDSDEDGLTDTEEIDYMTDKNNPDTDNDGINDKDEVDQKSDPLQPVVIILEANSNMLIPFTITVPATAGVGEHDGCVLIQEKKSSETGKEQGINLATRTGIRVAVTIPGDILRQLEVITFEIIDRSGGGKILHPVIKNTGNVSIDAKIKIVTKDIFGQIVAEHGGTYAILRGQTSEWNFELAQTFWGGWYTSYLTVEYDADPGAGTGVASGKPLTILSAPQAKFFLIPKPAALIIYAAVLVLIVIILLLWWLYQKRKKWIKKTWIQYTIQPGDGLKILAKQHDVSWRLLVKVNKLDPPYDLTPGGSLRVPPPKD